jgi:DivIVA domain-containing protein
MMNAPHGLFRVTRGRPGYAQDEVDSFIGRIEQTLAGQQAGNPVTAEDVRAARFRTVRLKPGYDAGDVDDALGHYERRLRQPR